MRNYSKLSKFIWAFIILLCISNYSTATPPSILHPFIVKLEPFSSLSSKYMSKISLTISKKSEWQCNEVPVLIEGTNGLTINSLSSFIVDLTKDSIFSTIIDLKIPSDVTSELIVTIKCGDFPDEYTRFFVSTGDSVVLWYGAPRTHLPMPKTMKTDPSDPIRDTLTQEQLSTKYEVMLDLREPSHFKIAEQILDSLPNTSKNGSYKLWITLDNLFKLAEKGIELDIDRRQAPPQQDSVKQKSNSIKQQ